MRLIVFVLRHQDDAAIFKPLGGDRRGGAAHENLERLDGVVARFGAVCLGALMIKRQIRFRRRTPHPYTTHANTSKIESKQKPCVPSK